MGPSSAFSIKEVDPVPVIESAAGHPEEVEELPETGRVGDQVPHRDGLVELG